MMDRLIEVKKREDISLLLDYVHDRSYKLSEIKYNASVHCLDIGITVVDNESFELKKQGILRNKWNGNIYRAVLAVMNVLDYSINDNAEIDGADICTIEYDKGVVEIIGSLPVTLKIQVSSLYLRLMISDKPFGTEQRTTYRFLGLESPNCN